jgi:hypothetical protein
MADENALLEPEVVDAEGGLRMSEKQDGVTEKWQDCRYGTTRTIKWDKGATTTEAYCTKRVVDLDERPCPVICPCFEERMKCPKCGKKMEQREMPQGEHSEGTAWLCGGCGLQMFVEPDGYIWKRCTECGAMAHLQGNAKSPHWTDYWECDNDNCHHEEELRSTKCPFCNPYHTGPAEMCAKHEAQLDVAVKQAMESAPKEVHQ